MKSPLPLFLIISILTVGNTSCSSVTEKIPVFSLKQISTVYNNSTYYLLNRLFEDDLTSLIEKKASFPLVVYAPGCGSCEFFDYALWDYVNQNKVVLNYMLLANYSSVSGLQQFTENTVVFFINGKIVSSTKIDSTNNSSDSFFKLMNQHTYISNVRILNTYYIQPVNQVPYLKYYTFSELAKPFEEEVSNQYITSLSPLVLEEEKAKVLFCNFDEINDFSELNTYLENSTSEADSIYFFTNKKDDSFALSSLFDKEGKLTYTIVDYSKNPADVDFLKTSVELL
ncbi:MAG: hypothetical protein WCR67_01445 [Bacilli bacterium]